MTRKQKSIMKVSSGSLLSNQRYLSKRLFFRSQHESFGLRPPFTRTNDENGSTTNLSSSTAPDDINEEETIFALSSGGGLTSATAVAVIRITGPQSHNALRILLSKTANVNPTSIKLPKARYASLRMIYDPVIKDQEKDRDPLDSALILLFNGPSSFTGQDMVELHTHGSRAVIQGVLSSLSYLSESSYNLSIRPAERGEFTERAYANGKLGLLEVEALADLIVADTSAQRLLALRQLDGRLSHLYESWREELIKGLAHAEAVIDFGDDEDLGADMPGDIEEDEDDDAVIGIWGAVNENIANLRNRMERHLSDAKRGEILRDGVRVAIIGPPNAGKSSLLNLLVNREAAIVSPIAGTTRDVIEVALDLGGVRCIVSDTAGLRDIDTTACDNVVDGDEAMSLQQGMIEAEGIKRARKVASDAHVLVCVVDTREEAKGIVAVNRVLDGIEQENDRHVLFLHNKVDLLNAADAESSPSLLKAKYNEKLRNIGKAKKYVISCETNDGIDKFVEALTESALNRVNLSNSLSSSVRKNNSVLEDEGAIITRSRHRGHVKEAMHALQRFEVRSGEGHMALDMAAEELRLAASELGRITGSVDVEDVLDVLFADFCIGK